MAVSSAGADAGTGGGNRVPTRAPRKPIGRDEEEKRLEAKGEMRRHLVSDTWSCSSSSSFLVSVSELNLPQKMRR